MLKNNFSDIISYLNIDYRKVEQLSSGINEFNMPEMYKRYLIKELENSIYIKDYYPYAGLPALNACIEIYEQLIAEENIYFSGDFPSKACLTVGGSAAITFLIKYFSEKFRGESIMLLGMNYALFFECCRYFKIECFDGISEEKNRILPTFDEITNILRQKRPKMLILVIPANPSGEIYSEEELSKIIKVAKEYSILLCIDKCQADEFNIFNDYINVYKIINKEEYHHNSIIINSLSKIRSLPGIRLGYIVSNREIIDYVYKMNFIYHTMPPSLCVSPFILDLICRTLFFYDKVLKANVNFEHIIKQFKFIIRTNDKYGNMQRLLNDVLNTEIIINEYNNFKDELLKMWETVIANYNYTLETLGKKAAGYTALKGGFNFCIKLRNTTNKTSLDICKDVLEKTNLLILPQECFISNPTSASSDFWIRISLAVPGIVFKKRLDKLSNYLESNGYL